MSAVSDAAPDAAGQQLKKAPTSPASPGVAVPDRGWRCAADGRRYVEGESATQQAARGIVNKLTDLTFDQLAQQMGDMVCGFIELGDEQSMHNLEEVVQVLYDIAVESDGPRDKHLGVLYARFCFAICQYEAQFTAQQTGAAQPLVGPTQFRKRMVGAMQRDFERCRTRMAGGGDPNGLEGPALKRQATGNINFLGQLFNQKLVTDKILHSVIQLLIGSGPSGDKPSGDALPSEDTLELVLELLRAVRGNFDTEKARDNVNLCFGRLAQLAQDSGLSARCRFRITDVIELRQRGWQDRRRGSH